MGLSNKLSGSMNLKNLVFAIGIGQILLSVITMFLGIFAVCIIDVITDKAILGIIADVDPEVGAELKLVHRIIRSVAMLYALFNIGIAAILIKANDLGENKALLPYLVQGSLNTGGFIILFIAMFLVADWLMVGLVAVGTVAQGIVMAIVAARYYQLNSKCGSYIEEEDSLLVQS